MATHTIKQGDTSPRLRAQLLDAAGNPINLVGAQSITFRMRKPNTTAYKVNSSLVTVENAAAGTVVYSFTEDDTDTPLVYRCDWVVVYADDGRETFPNSTVNAVNVEAPA